MFILCQYSYHIVCALRYPRFGITLSKPHDDLKFLRFGDRALLTKVPKGIYIILTIRSKGVVSSMHSYNCNGCILHDNGSACSSNGTRCVCLTKAHPPTHTHPSLPLIFIHLRIFSLACRGCIRGCARHFLMCYIYTHTFCFCWLLEPMTI